MACTAVAPYPYRQCDGRARAAPNVETRFASNRPTNTLRQLLAVTDSHLLLLLLRVARLLSLQTFAGSGPRAQEISFQEFQNQLLARGLVGRLEVVNGNTVRCVWWLCAGGCAVLVVAGTVITQLKQQVLTETRATVCC